MIEEISRLHWEILTEYLKNATPVEQVHFARWTNYDDVDILKWMINRPETDVVAALTVYFQMSPDFYANLSLEELDGYQIEDVKFLDEISKNVREGFYKESEITFRGSDFLDNDYDNKNSKREIPQYMLRARRGAIELDFELPVGFDEGLPNKVSEKIWSLYMPKNES